MKALRRLLFILAATVFAAPMVAIATSAQAGAPQTSPAPTPRPQAQPVQMFCDARDVVIEELGRLYGEVRRGYGVDIGEGSIFEIWASDATGTWTILETSWNGWT